jgi:hypothetical protein
MRTHPLNVSYLVVGLVYLGIAASWALQSSGVIELGDVEWLFPLTLILAGAIGLLAAAAKGRSSRTRALAGSPPATTPGTMSTSTYDEDDTLHLPTTDSDRHLDRHLEGDTR